MRIQRCGNTPSCSWGESSGGYELRCGEARVRVSSKGRCQQWHRFGGWLHRVSERNASNPTIGSGVQQIRKSFVTVNGDEQPGENPSNRRRKPTKSCETTGSERDLSLLLESKVVETPWEGGRRG